MSRTRRFHRWVSMVFMIGLIINVIAGILKVESMWITLLAGLPFLVLMLTGLCMFFAPYLPKRRQCGQVQAHG
jgi:hypothetical protein